MTRKTISDAVTNINAEYIEKAADFHVKKKSNDDLSFNAEKSEPKQVTFICTKHRFVVIFAAVLATLLLVGAGYYVNQVLLEKVKNTDMSQKEINSLGNALEEWGFSDENISDLNELQTNKNGLTYGPDALGADLIEVISNDGKLGYVYREDLEVSERNNITDALNSSGQFTINVYDCNGETVIGTFTLGKD